jgi:lipopolysaccharide transport system ATP-binding protein
MSLAISIENVSKVYQIGQIGTGTISRDVERWFVTKVMGREDPFLKLGQVNDRAVKGETDVVWSLKAIDLSIEQGDAIGIIGRNGAGKSTLLKLLSRVTAPTTGRIRIKGRVASLLEVGTGFHPELTGRENVYLNGSILGMRKKEIDRKFDEIIAFSGVERYIDTPVKRYSSGMSVRLAFAVAAHLESEILIVDEVLAVGDAEFQKKCIGKMEEIGQRDGRTVLFVSHNMGAIQEFCHRGIQIERGSIAFDGEVTECIANYFQLKRTVDRPAGQVNEPIILGRFEVDGSLFPSVGSGDSATVTVDFDCHEIDHPTIILIIENSFGQSMVHFTIPRTDLGRKNLNGTYKLELNLPPLWLSPGIYSIYMKFIGHSYGRRARVTSERIMMKVTGKFDNTGKTILTPDIEWSIERAERVSAQAKVFETSM